MELSKLFLKFIWEKKNAIRGGKFLKQNSYEGINAKTY